MWHEVCFYVSCNEKYLISNDEITYSTFGTIKNVCLKCVNYTQGMLQTQFFEKVNGGK